VVKPDAKRHVIDYLKREKGMSERRACGLIKFARSSQRYRQREKDDALVAEHLLEWAAKRRRFGYRQLYRILRREGHLVNHKRVQRIYNGLGLGLKRRRRKRLKSAARAPLQPATKPNEAWSMDFVSDSLANGRKIRCLNIVDDCTRENLAIEVDTSLPGLRVCCTLDAVAQERGCPGRIRSDNGPEFTGKALDEWAHIRGIQLDFIDPGKPTQNAYIESFNGRFRDECLNEHWFTDIMDARAKISAWREHYNGERPHSSLGGMTPNEFAGQWEMNKSA
jgi:putative transposase